MDSAKAFYLLAQCYKDTQRANLTLTATTTDTLMISTPGEGYRIKIVAVNFNNTDAANNCWLELKNGNGGTVLYKKRAGNTTTTTNTGFDQIMLGLYLSDNTALYVKSTTGVTALEIIVHYQVVDSN